MFHSFPRQLGAKKKLKWALKCVNIKGNNNNTAVSCNQCQKMWVNLSIKAKVWDIELWICSEGKFADLRPKAFSKAKIL